MNKTKNFRLTENSQALRKNMTSEEKQLWYKYLKKLPITVNRQKVIGKYIVDFYCAEAKLIIEIDGSQHYKEEEHKKDEIRDQFFKDLGIEVLRFSNLDVKKRFNDVCRNIYAKLPDKVKKFTTHPSSKLDTFPSRGR